MLAQESTLEEDYFAELLLGDDSDEEVQAPKSRDARMRQAFLSSQVSYKAAHAVTEPGWYVGLTHDDRMPEAEASEAIDIKLLEGNIAHLYHTKSYLPCLELCLSWIEDHPDSPAKDMLETGMLACLKVGPETGGKGMKLVERTRKIWKQSGQSGLVYIAALVLQQQSQFKDASVALLYALQDRFYRKFVVTLAEVMASWSNSSPSSAIQQALSKLLPSVDFFSVTALDPGPLYPKTVPANDSTKGSTTENTLETCPEIPGKEEVAFIASGLGYDETQTDLLQKLCQKLINFKQLRAAKGVGGDGEEGVDQGRSVRTL